MTLLPYAIAITCIAILLFNRARISITFLLVEYLLAFIISLPSLPLRTLLARVIGGIVICAILYYSTVRYHPDSRSRQDESLPRSLWFRIITSLIVFIVAWAFAGQSRNMPASLNANVFLGALFNICLGLLMVGLYQSPLEAAIGLLTLFIGFDLFYGSIEPSLAIVVLMISLQLIISLATSYMMSIAQNDIASGGEPT